MPPVHPLLAQAFALSGEGREDEARAIIERLAGEGDAGALFTLGDMYWRGVAVETDAFKARELFGRASEAGHPVAARAYTNLLASGIAGPRDWPQALARLRVEGQSDALRGHMLALIAAMDLTSDGEPRSLPEGKLLTESPHVTMYSGLFTRAECEFLAIVAEPSYEASRVGSDDDEGGELVPFRTSEGATLHWLIEDPATHALSRRLAAISGTHVSQAEPMQILRYRPGQEYKRHLDYQPGAENQRILTALVYLNEAYTGGETFFVKVGMQVRGHFGDCIVFRNTIDGERADPMSEHAGLPVTAGTKLLASRWIRARPRAPVRGAAQALFN